MTITAKNLTIGKRLRDVSATLNEGQITAICGPNGAGKSTFLQAISGLLAPDAGEVALGAQPLLQIPARERAQRIGYLPQDGEIAWDVAVSSLVALGRLPHGDADPEPVRRAIAALDLEGLVNRPVSQLSGGERARALLARVLAGEPEWILADEPLAALDLSHQLSLLGQLRGEASEGTGVVLVLHDLSLAMNHADRVLVFDDGELAADGPPEQALSARQIAQVWGVKAKWLDEGLGEAGARALIAR